MKKAQQQFLTKSAAALMIPIAVVMINHTYGDLSFHAAEYEHSDSKHKECNDADCSLEPSIF